MAQSSQAEALGTERILLAAVLIADAQVLPRLLADPPSLRAEHFSVEAHRLVFAAAVELREASVPVDAVTVCDALDRVGQLERAGGSEYLNSLLDVFPKLDLVGLARKLIEASATSDA